jgi:hypothetical protein
MARKKKDRTYYGVDQERAVILYLDAKTVTEKEEIYRNYLQEPINKMIESIIRTYKLYRPTYEFEDLHTDTLSFLMTKFDKFKPEKGKKSFSYFGTICRNYLFGEMIKDYKKSTKTTEMENVPTEVWGRADLVTHIDNEVLDLSAFIEDLIMQVQNELKLKNLTDNEFKVGHSLIKILEEWKVLFADPESGKNSPKFNKNLILLYIRNMTGLTTKEIRNSMKRFKVLYFDFKDEYLED